VCSYKSKRIRIRIKYKVIKFRITFQTNIVGVKLTLTLKRV